MKKNLLISGAGGFVGSSFINRLKKKYNIYAIFKNAPKINPGIKKEIILDFSKESLMSLPQGIDTVIHLAQSNFYRDQENYADDIVDLNIVSTLKLLEWAKNTNVKNFIFTSTGNVYKPSDALLTEDSPLEPNSIYGASKLSAEILIKQYKKYFNINILRLFSVYGPYQKNMLIPQITNKLLSKEKITLADSKGIYLTPIYIQDLIDVFEKIIDEDSSSECCETYNVSGNEILSLRDILLILSQHLKIEPIIESTNDQVSYLTGSGKKLTEKFELKYLTSIEQGINNFIKSI